MPDASLILCLLTRALPLPAQFLSLLCLRAGFCCQASSLGLLWSRNERKREDTWVRVGGGAWGRFRRKILEELRDGGEGDEGGKEFPEILFCFMYPLLNIQGKEVKALIKKKEKENSPIVGLCPLSASALRLCLVSCGFCWVINTRDWEISTAPKGRNARGNQTLRGDGGYLIS